MTAAVQLLQHIAFICHIIIFASVFAAGRPYPYRRRRQSHRQPQLVLSLRTHKTVVNPQGSPPDTLELRAVSSGPPFKNTKMVILLA